MNHQGYPPAEGELHRDPCLEEIEEEDAIAPLLAEHAQGVGGADIAAPFGADVDAAEAPCEVAKGDRSDQVGSDGDQKPRKKGMHEWQFSPRARFRGDLFHDPVLG